MDILKYTYAVTTRTKKADENLCITEKIKHEYESIEEATKLYDKNAIKLG